MRAIREAKLEVFEVGNESFTEPDFVVPDYDIASVDATVRLSRRKDTATIELHNDVGQYSNNSDTGLHSGQRIQFRITTEGDIVSWGEDTWGEGAWGGQHLRWTGLIRDVTYNYEGPNKSYITLKADEFVFGVMSKRLIFDTYADKPIAGTNDAILDHALEAKAPEISQSRIQDFSQQKTSISSDGMDLLEFALALTRRSDGVMYSRRNRLHFEHLDDKSPKFELKGTDMGFFEVEIDDTGLVNSVRVDGGTNQAVDDEQLTQDGYETVSKNSRKMFQISTRKSQISDLELWTDRTGSEENMTVRIQKDDGGAPIAPDDNTSDIASKTLNEEFIQQGDFTQFILPDHTLPEPNPWIIIETDGESGQNVGVDTSTGTPSYKAYYNYTVTIRQSDYKSKNKYRLREARISDESLRTGSEARAVSAEKLNHDSVPEKTIQGPADSERAHHLKVGQVISVDFPRENAQGDYIVTERDDTYEGNQLTTTIEAQEVDSI